MQTYVWFLNPTEHAAGMLRNMPGSKKEIPQPCYRNNSCGISLYELLDKTLYVKASLMLHAPRLRMHRLSIYGEAVSRAACGAAPFVSI